ncbi:GIY-YIG nuclease family protein [Stenotrophomonas indicatrix]|uniref:GIY-YIG nuclease family protein n=1 Tax=Stenotrophomonas indicatrix TaxID=2045451 RepID=UPI0028AC78AE|nr:GIY-YIG nuclease family protein [Stenotrophomonas indicatrix]
MNESIGYVYCIKNETTNACKIGWAFDPEERVKSFRTGSDGRLILVGSFPGSRSHEAAAHAELSGRRIRGEWFDNEGGETEEWFSRLQDDPVLREGLLRQRTGGADRHQVRPFPLRLRTELRGKLEHAASESGRSVNAEAARRIELSFSASLGFDNATAERLIEALQAYVAKT